MQRMLIRRSRTPRSLIATNFPNLKLVSIPDKKGLQTIKCHRSSSYLQIKRLNLQNKCAKKSSSILNCCRTKQKARWTSSTGLTTSTNLMLDTRYLSMTICLSSSTTTSNYGALSLLYSTSSTVSSTI